MRLSTEDVRYIARLARLRLTEDEEVEMAQQMHKILEYVDQLNELDTDGVEPMSHVLELNNVFRNDVSEIRISHEEALKNAPDTEGTNFRVPKVIE